MRDDETTMPDDDSTEVTGDTRTKPVGRGVGRITVPDREPGDTIGRYEVLEVVAKGGMGVVYEAYDPELDRRIALKLLLSTDDGALTRVERRERMLREAQALAQLSHPNVIAVFDAGIVDGDVFIAMELVKGTTLTKWLDKAQRGHAEILSVLARAGEGLAAAHDAGLVHRDIKPSNIIVGDDGRVRVIDFGLARVSDSLDVQPPDSDDSFDSLSGSSERWLDSTLTRAGVIMGTPRYMAPEQHAGRAVDHLSDQYSYAATLYRALHGVCPIERDDYRQIREAAIAGDLDEPPANTRVGRHLTRVLARGLARKPDDRYPSLRDMITDMRRDPRARVRRAAAAVAIVSAVGLLVVATTSGREAAARCPAVNATIQGVWDGDAKRRIRRGFEGSGRVYQSASYDLVVASLDDYARRISTMRHESCVATNKQRVQSDEMFDLRSACLERRVERLAALVSILSKQPSAAIVDKATDASRALPPVSECADATALRAAVPLPADPDSRAAIARLRNVNARARAHLSLGEYKRGLELVRGVEAQVRALAYAPLTARVLYTLGELHYQHGKLARSVETYEHALVEAARAKDNSFLAYLWIEYVELIGVDWDRHDKALTLAKAAEIAIVRAGNSPALRAQLDSCVGAILAGKGKFADAAKHLRAAIAVQKKLDDPAANGYLTTINRMAAVLKNQGKYDDAAAMLKELIERLARRHGEDHHTVASANYNLSLIYSAAGRYDEAWPYLDKGRRMLDRILEKNDPRRALVLTAGADLLRHRGKLDQARAYLKQALEIRRAAKVTSTPEHAQTLQNLGDVLVEQRQYARARPHLDEALALRRRYLPANHPQIGESLAAIASLLWNQNKLAEATAYYQQTLAIYKVAYGAKHPFYAVMLLNLGDLAMEQHKYADAVRLLEQAVAVLEPLKNTPARAADARFALAKALWALGKRSRARELAALAQHGFARAGAAYKDNLHRVKTWLQTHR